MKKVMVVLPYYCSLGGGVYQYVKHIVEGLSDEYHVEVFSLDENRFKLSNTSLYVPVGKLYRKIRDGGFDIVVGHAPVPGVADFACLICKIFGVPFILTYHAGSMKKGGWTDVFIWLYEKLWLPLLVKLSSEVIVCSEYVKGEFLDGSVVFPGVDCKVFRSGTGQVKKQILFVGLLDRGHRWKGLDVLISAMEGVDAKLVVVGEGDYRTKYEMMASDVECEFFGHLEHYELSKVMQESMAIVLPSVSTAESFGMVLLEGAACGLPMIGSNIGGIPHLIKDGVNGFLFSPGDAYGLREKIRLIVSDDGLRERLGRNALEFSRGFSWEKSVEKTLVVLSRAQNLNKKVVI